MKKSAFMILAALAGSVSAGEFGAVVKGTSGFRAQFNSPSARGSYVNDPGTLTPNSNHEYDNGYVRDNPGPSGATPDWGFDREKGAVVTPISGSYANGATITYSSKNISGDGVNQSEDASAIEPGFELFFRDLPWKSQRTAWGYMVGLTYQRVRVKNGGTASFSSETTTDTYTYTGIGFPDVNLPAFPSGRYDNADPWLYLPDQPTSRAVTPGTDYYPYGRRLEADLLGVKAGPCLEVNLSEDFFLVLGAGVSAQWIQSKFTYSDAGVSGETSDNGCLSGAFLQGDLEYALTERCRIFGGAEWMLQQSFSQSANGYDSKLSGSSLVAGRLGVAFAY